MKRFLAVVLLVFLVSCKSKSVVVEATKATTRMSSNKIIENYYNNKIDFSTLYIKSNVEYADDKQTQNVTAEIKIKKDEQILVSIRFLGITMAKASITPTSVSYYEKMGGKYYEGDFTALSQLLGTDLDFNKMQNMLLGRAIDDLNKGKYAESFADQVYRLDNALGSDVKKSFYFDANTFLVNKQEITQTAQGRMIQVAYSDNIVYKQATLPSKININTFQEKGKARINFEYNTITFNEELSFPYSVPNGYKRIIIK
jgi:hypothetical protein